MSHDRDFSGPEKTAVATYYTMCVEQKFEYIPHRSSGSTELLLQIVLLYCITIITKQFYVALRRNARKSLLKFINFKSIL